MPVKRSLTFQFYMSVAWSKFCSPFSVTGWNITCCHERFGPNCRLTRPKFRHGASSFQLNCTVWWQQIAFIFSLKYDDYLCLSVGNSSSDVYRYEAASRLPQAACSDGAVRPSRLVVQDHQEVSRLLDTTNVQAKRKISRVIQDKVRVLRQKV